MKKYVLILFILSIWNITIQAQTQQEIDSPFKVGDYSQAIRLVNQMDSIAEAEHKAEKKCNAYLKDAEWYFKRGFYGKSFDMLDKALSYNIENKKAYSLKAESAENKIKLGNGKWYNRFSFGVAGGMDFLSVNFASHIGLSVKYGYYRDLVNVVLGVEYNQHFAYENRYDFEENGIDVIGSQIAIPLWVKLNLVDVSNSCRFYVGAGAEYGIRLTARQNYTGRYYPTDMIAMPSSSIAGLVHLGLTMRHVDVGLYYKGYFDDIVLPPYFYYMENSRVGFNVAYYF